jgi:glutathione synthase/RimK-type ligase-like ATP-grasp enzyme
MRASMAGRGTRGGRAPSFRFKEGPCRLVDLQRSFGGFAASLCGADFGGCLGLSARRFGPSASGREILIGRLARHLAVRRGNAIWIFARLALMALMKIGDFFWINHPERERLADSKPAQLYAARKFGLEIAPTIITNNPDEVRSFLAHTKGAVVYKGLTQPLNMEPGKALFTRQLTEKEIANLDLISVTPGIFQAHIEKAYEVRATVVGSRIFAAKIDSQSAFATRTDWRRAPFEVQYEAISLPPEIETGIHDLMRHFDLVYGA